jgi:AcrR family transcriptional regulator
MPANAAAIAPPVCTAPQSRILVAALALFAEHGISGTSLQMIADAIGVTKAAVYHQYNTKDEIVLAVASDVLAALEAAVTAAETWRPRSRARARAVLIDHMVDLAVERRQMAGVLQRDPVMLRFLQEHAPFRRVMERVNRVLLAGSIDPAARVLTAILTSAIAGTVIHPLAMQLDDARLRSQLIRQLRKLLTR